MDLLSLIELAKVAAVKAGKEILKVYQSDDLYIEMKGDSSPLTVADQAAHDCIVEGLANSGLPVLSEEGRSIPFQQRSMWEYFWLVDPLDGTKEFIQGNGEFTVNIALINGNDVVGGVVYVPVSGSLYCASKGNGAFLKEPEAEERILKIHPGQPVSAIVASRLHLSPETAEFISRYPEADIISMGSSLKFMMVAEGRAQLYPRFAPTMEWDTAAAQAIVEEAGGFVLAYPSLKKIEYNKEDLLNGWFLVTAGMPQ